MYLIHPQNDNFEDLLFYADQRLITGWQIYCINDDITEMLDNGSIIDVYVNRM